MGSAPDALKLSVNWLQKRWLVCRLKSPYEPEGRELESPRASHFISFFVR